MSTAKIIGSIVLLMLFDMSIHPLTLGPDRRIHDPAVYRLADSTYLEGDWYTDMAVQSRVYPFYSKLVHIGPTIGIPEEMWRLSLYLASLAILYYSMLRIAWLFSKSMLVIPIVAIVHAVMITVARPIWLYGPFIQIDGGLAPRSIGVALSFLALFFLLKNSLIVPALLLGVATLIHVSNSLIVFSLFFPVWLVHAWLVRTTPWKSYWIPIFQKALVGISCYLVAGGWFAFYAAHASNAMATTFSAEKFIWTWIYFRAPYMALPLMPWRSWLLFALHAIAIGIGWYFVSKSITKRKAVALNMLGCVGIASVFYFFVFYLFAFIYPWLPGFQFYSIRVIYFAYFIAYLFMGLLSVQWYRAVSLVQKKIIAVALLIIGLSILFGSAPGTTFMKRSSQNILASWQQLRSSGVPVPSGGTTRYIFFNPEPFLAPPHWYSSSYYLPTVASFKSFGFTPQGIEQWYERLNDVSKGRLEVVYQSQRSGGIFRPVTLDWAALYSQLSAEDIVSLSQKYHFTLFLTYASLSYPFPVVAEDGDFRLYQVRY